MSGWGTPPRDDGSARMAELDRLIAEEKAVRGEYHLSIREGARPGPIRPPLRTMEPIGGPPPVPPIDSEAIAALAWIWSHRRCFICNGQGYCGHREPDVDLAEIEAWSRRVRSKA